MNTNNKIKSAVGIYGTYFLAGMMITIFGPVNALISENYNVSLASLGLLITFMSIGRIATSFFVGVFFPKIKNKILLILGIIFILIGSLFISIFEYSNMMYIFALFMGLGHGLFDISGNSMISEMFPHKKGNALNFLHLFFSLGSFLGPSIFALVINGFGEWYFAFYALFILSFIIFIYNFMFLKSKENKTSEKKYKFTIKSILILLGFIMFFYVGVSQGLNAWVNTYLSESQKVNIINSSIVLSLYNLGLMLGRVIASKISEKVGYSKMIIISSFGAVIFVFIAVIVSNIFFIAISLLLTGMFLGPIFPTSVALATHIFKNNKQEVSGLLSAIASGGSMLIPLISGGISDVFENIKYGMYLFVVMLVFMFLLSITVFMKSKKGE